MMRVHGSRDDSQAKPESSAGWLGANGVCGAGRYAASVLRLALLLVLGALVIFVYAPRVSASAVDVYISQSGAGGGTSCADSFAVSWFNTAGNWGTGAGQIGPGTTVHLCGTFSVSAGTNLLAFQGSGTSGNPITLLFESGAVLSSPAFSQSAGAINVGGNSWIVVNGGANGIIQNTANGSGLTYHQPSSGILVGGSNNIIENLTIANMCVHVVNDPNGCIAAGANDTGMYVWGSNITITRNTIHDTQTGIQLGSGAQSNITISYNTISRVNWGVGGGTYNATQAGILITGNDISCVLGSNCNWDSSDDVHFHHNGIMLYPQGTGGMNGVVIANNLIRDFGYYETGHIFIDPNGSASLPGMQIYNNVFATTPGASGPGYGFITLQQGSNQGSVVGAIVANNTMLGGAGHGLIGQFSPTFKNNIIVGPYNAEWLYPGYTSVASDYNDLYNITGGSLSFTAGSTNYGSLSAWQTALALDAHSVTTNPNLNADYTLSASLPGTNLTSLGISGLNVGAPQYFGVNYACGNGCTPRPISGNWDMGAYAYHVSSASSSQPSPPTTLSAVVQ